MARPDEDAHIADSLPDDETDSTGEPGDPPGTPLWVKVTGAVALVVILLIAGVVVVGGEDHGPGQHGSGDGDPDGDHDGGDHNRTRGDDHHSTGGGPRYAG